MNIDPGFKYDEKFSTEHYDFPEIAYEHLMQKRIINVLLICSNYDAFMLEEDGRINEKIFLEYTSKNLRYPPKFTKASSSEEAFGLLEEKDFDLIITMLNVGKIDAFEMAQKIKKRYPKTPIVVLTHFSREVSMKLANEDMSSIDYVFSWLGNPGLLVGIIKLLEDRMNAEFDIDVVGVQAILLVEDSVRYYSSYLPSIYKVIFDQTSELMTEGLNEHRKTLRMRARPKILLAKTYEEAVSLFEKYHQNLLGVISDISYPRNNQKDTEAGIRFARHIRQADKNIPILLQSSQARDENIINELRAGFIHKYSKTLLVELKNYIRENYGFGDFIFKDPATGLEEDRANNLHVLQEKIAQISSKSLEFHISNNHFSRWLKARALFSIAHIFAEKSRDDFNNLEEIRSYLIDTIANFRRMKGRGIIASRFDDYAVFTRLGDGQLGGKARGLAFIDLVVNKYKMMSKWDGVTVTIPRTVVLTTDMFDEFMEKNALYDFALSNASDQAILERFTEARTPPRLRSYVTDITRLFYTPLAIRSSSLLEDSHYQPFAGVYSTYMIPNNHTDPNVRIMQLEQAIKSVYASVFYRESKAFIAATSNVIDEEKMAVVIQEVSGRAYGDKFYPALSGVARSINFYPIEPERYEDGVAKIAFGLGKTIVEGGLAIRFSPAHPDKSIQLSSPEFTLRDSQKEFYSLNLDPEKFKPSLDDAANLFKLRITDAIPDGSLKFVASTFDYQDNIVRDGLSDSGIVVVSYSAILRYKTFPLAEIIRSLLEIGQKEMNNQVEIEFAANLDAPEGQNKTFYFLQIRPVVEGIEKQKVKIDTSRPEKAIILSFQALGNGNIDNLRDLIYVKPSAFNPANTKEIAATIEKLNGSFVASGKNYILIGPGRWGSSDPWLGIPVKWTQISAARIIVESGLKDFQIDPSQGTHFFQNLTSFNVGYFTINPHYQEGIYDVEFLDKINAVFENEHLRHVRFESPLVVKIDGSKRTGIILKPEK
ncbi:MAG TPA: PEP/pyruvate-binding domain-containing protein [Bacteroidales bacterium]|nr:PEP/pyruvate-binding domain-containing protein [Bacteroidales bacterium]